jgi:Flp pilus assembly protein TadD
MAASRLPVAPPTSTIVPNRDAMAEFQIAIILNPNLPSAHEELGIVLHRLGDHVGADLEADKALALRERP